MRWWQARAQPGRKASSLRTARKAFYRIVNGLSDFRSSPDVGELQLIDRKVLKAVLQHNDHFPYIRGIIASVGFRSIIVPYTWRARARGISKHRFCTIVGLVISALCLLFSFASVIAFILSPDLAPRGTTTIIVSLCFLSGIQMLFIGMLGEYITSIHNQVRGGPMVVERELINIGVEEE